MGQLIGQNQSSVLLVSNMSVKTMGLDKPEMPIKTNQFHLPTGWWRGGMRSHRGGHPPEFDPNLGRITGCGTRSSFQLSLQSLTRGTTKGLRRARRLRSRWIPVISRRTRFRSVCNYKSVCTRVLCV